MGVLHFFSIGCDDWSEIFQLATHPDPNSHRSNKPVDSGDSGGVRIQIPKKYPWDIIGSSFQIPSGKSI